VASPGSGQSASNSCRRIREKSFRITAGSVHEQGVTGAYYFGPRGGKSQTRPRK
jgi:hypothetical protein